jgi:arsenite methyltransferase
MSPLDPKTVLDTVRERYGTVARQQGSSCCSPGCCGGSPSPSESSQALGYTAQDLASIPSDADMGLGCGNPQAIASLRPGETVVDLGSGGGLDVFLAARQVGPRGRAIGVDMTPDMLSLARKNAAQAGLDNVEFRLGEIDALPLPNQTADVIMSNCVINLAPDKRAVYDEAFRVLRPGGRLAISDVVALAPLPTHIQQDLALLAGCVAGAATVDELETVLEEAGFADVRIDIDPRSRDFIQHWAPGRGIEEWVASASITARRPLTG